MRRVLRVLLVVGLVLVVLVVGAAAYVGWTIRRSYPQVAGTVTVPGLTAEVEVQRDANGIPTIVADTADDLFFGQGYVHAQDRFWEMDFRRHVTSGRLAEWFGDDQVETDAFIRTMGWRRVAAQELPRLQPDTRRYLEAYADGVNAYLATHSGSSLSFEHWLLGLVGPSDAPEPWTPVDSLAWLKAMAWDLRGNMQDELDRARLEQTIDPARVAQLYPPYPYDRHAPIVTSGQLRGDTWVPEATSGPGDGGDSSTARHAYAASLSGSIGPALDAAAAHFDALDAVLGPPGSGIGSNSWVIGGAKSASGLPILANDPHLSAAMPSTWYQVHLRCSQRTAECPFDVGGFSFSGLPGVIIGRTTTMAWGFTNLDPDVSDLVIERLRGDDVATTSGLEPLDVREETIKVAGGDPVTITVRSSSHGPLISDADSDYLDVAASPAVPPSTTRTEYAVALRWTALQPGNTADAIFTLNAARGWDDFRAAARLFEVPAQNLVYADVEGNIGYQAPGKIPIRSAGGDGTHPVLGWTGHGEWIGWVPFDALPYETNPREGYIVAANQAVVGADYPYHLADTWSYGFRSQRIADVIQSTETFDVAAVQRLQVDTFNRNAAFLVPRLPPPPTDDFYAEAQALLDGWDYTQPPDSAGAAYFNAFWRHLLRLMFHDEMPAEALPDGGDRWFEVVRQLWDTPADEWWDDRSTATREVRTDIVEAALVAARDELTNRLAKDPNAWEWGRLHTLELVNPTFGTSGIGLIEAIVNRGPVRVGGGSSIVDATGWDASTGSYTVDEVPSMRMVIDLGDSDGGTWINLTGQSGHPYAATYVDQLDLWVSGQQLHWAWTQTAIDAATTHRLVLVPSSEAGARPG